MKSIKYTIIPRDLYKHASAFGITTPKNKIGEAVQFFVDNKISFKVTTYDYICSVELTDDNIIFCPINIDHESYSDETWTDLAVKIIE